MPVLLGQAQILLHGHFTEQPTAFQHDRYAVPRAPVRSVRCQAYSILYDQALRDRGKSTDRINQGCLPGSIGADDSDRLAFAYVH